MTQQLPYWHLLQPAFSWFLRKNGMAAFPWIQVAGFKKFIQLQLPELEALGLQLASSQASQHLAMTPQQLKRE